MLCMYCVLFMDCILYMQFMVFMYCIISMHLVYVFYKRMLFILHKYLCHVCMCVCVYLLHVIYVCYNAIEKKDILIQKLKLGKYN